MGWTRWDLPLRLLGAVHSLVLAGEAPALARAYAGEGDPWPPFRALLAGRRDELARLVATRAVQTNEVQRCFALLPAFLTVAARAGGRPLELIELGPAAGLNLLFDRYRYRYPAGGWGPPGAPLLLEGEVRRPFPASLLAQEIRVAGRTGIDLEPVDVTTERGARLLQSFVWADQRDRLARLRRAIEVVRSDPPRLLRGDYVRLLPGLLAARPEGALTVVFQTASTGYLASGARAELRRTLERAGEQGPLALLSTRTPEEEDEDGDHEGYALELRLWPGGRARVLARFDFHGAWLDWLG